MTTTTQTFSVRQALDEANPSLADEALTQVKLGTQSKLIKATIAAMTASQTPDITAIPAAKITINQGPDNVVSSGILPPIGVVKSLRVSASGTATVVGTYAIGDASATALTASTSGVVGLATLSDDGKTLGFTATITGFVIEYWAAPLSTLSPSTGLWVAGDVNAEFGQPGGGLGDE